MKCIRMRDTGELKRVCDEIAQKLVTRGEAEFIPKHEFRAAQLQSKPKG